MTMNRINGFFEAANYIAAKNLVQGSSGNLSLRTYDIINITASGSWFEFLTVNEIITCNIITGEPTLSNPDKLKPSSELKMHLAIYHKRSDVNVVLHCQSPYATTLSTMLDKATDPSLDFLNLIPEIPYYIRSVRKVAYYAPGSTELANAVADQCTEGDAMILQNHGQVIIGKDFEDVIQKALFLELAAQCYLMPPQLNCPTHLSHEHCLDLKHYKFINENA